MGKVNKSSWQNLAAFIVRDIGLCFEDSTNIASGRKLLSGVSPTNSISLEATELLYRERNGSVRWSDAPTVIGTDVTWLTGRRGPIQLVLNHDQQVLCIVTILSAQSTAHHNRRRTEWVTHSIKIYHSVVCRSIVSTGRHMALHQRQHDIVLALL